MIMVLEMIDVFHLLVPAALTVVLSYLVQMALTERLKFRSLYEAQVPTRPDSPAHHTEHLEAVLRLLVERKIAVPAHVSPLDLRTLLETGIPIELPGHKPLGMGKVKANSDLVGKSVSALLPLRNGGDLELVASIRNGHTLFSHPSHAFQARGRLVLIASPKEWETLNSHLEQA